MCNIPLQHLSLDARRGFNKGRTDNGCHVFIYPHKPGQPINAIVIRSTDHENFPVGTHFQWRNEMGHVMCGGNDNEHQELCAKHPLDLDDNGNVAWIYTEQGRIFWISDREELEHAEAAALALPVHTCAEPPHPHHAIIDQLAHDLGQQHIESIIGSDTPAASADVIELVTAATEQQKVK